MDKDEAALLLERISDEGLLRTFAALTHRLHAVGRMRSAQSKSVASSVREQRDRVQGEILERMGRLPERDRSRGNPDGEMVRDQPPSGPSRGESHE